jgi:hypothetical protein
MIVRIEIETLVLMPRQINTCIIEASVVTVKSKGLDSLDSISLSDILSTCLKEQCQGKK